VKNGTFFSVNVWKSTHNIARNSRFMPLGRFGWWIAVLTVVAIAMFWIGERWAFSSASESAGSDARQLATSNASLFNSELEKFQLLQVALAEYPDVAEMLNTGGNNASQVNDRLERLAEKTNAAAIYVIDASGKTLAASNYRTPASFVGQNYAFRPYFKNAIAKGSAELFALGTISGRPGLYLARRIMPGATPLGVIVVKVEFDQLARQWSRQTGTSIVAESHGIVIISGRPEWQFRTLRELEALEKTQISAIRQFEGASLKRLPFDTNKAIVTIEGEAHHASTIPVRLVGGSLTVLMPTQRFLEGARAQARIIAVLVLFAFATALTWQYRQIERAAMQDEVQRDLKKKVAERTAELERTNQLLVIESAERANSEQRYRASREELAQANRLGTLGQVTAGVAHEINQPIAAIRAFAENAITFLNRSRSEKASENLQQIVSLTDRVATITAELRGFAKQKTPAVGPTSLADAIEASLLLVNHRISESKTVVEWDKRTADVSVRADRIRLEQVFVNLIQNSLDALETVARGHIQMTFAPENGQVLVVVSDNGPGFPKELEGKVFTPFSSGKEQGLGLGLAIARDIVRAFGGDIAVLDGSGARVELRFIKA
jgi:two-component system, NtrC family, C4-dicarboxylate transport sensor histidine kinase DctB